MEASENKQFTIPYTVITPIDIARIKRELGSLDEFLRQAAIRTGGEPQNIPRYSRLLDDIVQANGLNLLKTEHREYLHDVFTKIESRAPVLHISFSADPPGNYVQKIVSWLRDNIHPMILVRVGLQPNIGAGCVVRTTNKSFDFSLRSYFDQKHEFFIKKLHEVLAPEMQKAPAVTVNTTQTQPRTTAAAPNQPAQVTRTSQTEVRQ